VTTEILCKLYNDIYFTEKIETALLLQYYSVCFNKNGKITRIACGRKGNSAPQESSG